jgi:hypothetical protein
MPEPYRVPSLLSARRLVWAIDCAACGRRVRLGPGSKAGVVRRVQAVGPLCGACRSPLSDAGPGTA